MTITDRQLLNSLSRMPFIDSAGLAGILGEPHTTVHRALAGLLGDGMVGRVNHGTAYLPSSQRYYLTAKGVSEAAGFLGFDTPSDFVRSYPVSSEWLTLLIRRMDVVASVYRLAASMSPGTDGRSSPRAEAHTPDTLWPAYEGSNIINCCHFSLLLGPPPTSTAVFVSIKNRGSWSGARRQRTTPSRCGWRRRSPPSSRRPSSTESAS